MIETKVGSFEPEHRMLIDGALVDALSGKQFDNINPATEEVLGQVADGSHEDMSRRSRPPGARSTRRTGRRITRSASAAWSSCRKRSRPTGSSSARSWLPRWAPRS